MNLLVKVNVHKSMCMLMSVVALFFSATNDLGAMGNVLEREAQEFARSLEYDLRDKRRLVADLVQKMEDCKVPGACSDAYINSLQQQMNKAGQAEAAIESVQTGILDTVGGFFKGAADIHLYELNKGRREEEAKEALKSAALNAKMGNQGSMERLKYLTEYLTNPQTLYTVGGAIVVVTGALVCVYYGGKLLFNYFNDQIGKTEFVRESSFIGWHGRLKQQINEKVFGKKVAKKKVDSVILDSELALEMKNFADDTKRAKENGLPFQNLMLYGPPGTGKTMLARAIAQECDMDWIWLSGADALKSSQTLAQLYDVFAKARQSKKGTFIFIDECDACCGKIKGDTELAHRSAAFVTALKDLIGSQSYDFAIGLGTNYPEDLEISIKSRMDVKKEVKLPNEELRKLIIEQKLNEYIRGQKRTYKKHGKKITVELSVDPAIDAAYIDALASKTEGFSGRELDKMIIAAQIRTYAEDNVLSKELMDKVATTKIKEFNAEKALQQKHKKGESYDHLSQKDIGKPIQDLDYNRYMLGEGAAYD